MSDFAFPNFPGVLFYQCVGVSKTSDPVAGGWWLYAIQIDAANPTFLGDYPKFGLWPDAYYFSVNMFSNNFTFNGVRVFALPRNSMINGTGAPNAGAIAFTVDPATLGDTYSLVPAGFRAGSPPPAGHLNIFWRSIAPAPAGVVQTQVRSGSFTSISPLQRIRPLESARITRRTETSQSTGLSTHIHQPRLSCRKPERALSLIHWVTKSCRRVVYQNLGGTESLWASHTVNNNQGGTGPTGIRWYQFNITGSTIPATAVQQQTFTNGADSLWRWMPSIAVDAQGNMAIAYSTSSSTQEPSIRYAGRLVGEPLNTLGQGEAVMQAGGGHQTSTSARWGDYSALGIDPADSLTFWHTHEYYSATSGSAWNTRIGKFKFPGAPSVVGAVSRKAHGGAGNFDIILPATGNAGIEDRVGPVAGAHQIIVNFAGSVSVSTASVISGTGNVANFSTNAGQVTVNLSGVADAQVLTVKLGSVSDGVNTGDVSIRMAVLPGDTNGGGSVNATDVSQTKLQSGQAVTGTNFRTDVNANGSINATDVSLVKLKSGTALPP